MKNKVDEVMTDKYGIEIFGLKFNWKVRYFVAKQDCYFYVKRCWLNPTKSKAATDQMYFQYSIN